MTLGHISEASRVACSTYSILKLEHNEKGQNASDCCEDG